MTIELNDIAIEDIQIFNALGALVKMGTATHQDLFNLDISLMIPGVYQVWAQAEDGRQWLAKLVVQ